jgi:hypothetical protein
LLHTIRHFEDAAIVSVAADDQHADRESSGVCPAGTEAAGHRVALIQ